MSAVVLGCRAYARRLRARDPGHHTGCWRAWGEEGPRRQLARCAGLFVGSFVLAALEGALPPGAVGDARFCRASLTALLVTLIAIVGVSLRRPVRRLDDRCGR